MNRFLSIIIALAALSAPSSAYADTKQRCAALWPGNAAMHQQCNDEQNAATIALTPYVMGTQKGGDYPPGSLEYLVMARCIGAGEDVYGPNYAMVLDCVEGQISASKEMKNLVNQIGAGKKYPPGSPTHQIAKQCSDKWADGLGLNYVQFKRCVDNGTKYGITP